MDETINLDMLAERIRNNVANLYLQTLKIAQTQPGITQQISVINGACEEQVTRNAIAPGVWTGPDVGNLKTGDTLILGFLVIAGSLSDQSQADREARKTPPFTVPVKMAGASHSAIVNVNVNR